MYLVHTSKSTIFDFHQQCCTKRNFSGAEQVMAAGLEPLLGFVARLKVGKQTEIYDVPPRKTQADFLSGYNTACNHAFLHRT